MRVATFMKPFRGILISVNVPGQAEGRRDPVIA